MDKPVQADSAAANKLLQLAAELGITLLCKFIPWSGDGEPTLRWSVQLLVGGEHILTSPYTAGCGHCPSYKPGPLSVDEWETVKYECRSGRRYGRYGPHGATRAIDPNFSDVLSAIARDADAITYANFEDWAEAHGMDDDSRKAESMYKECLAIGLALQSTIGYENIERLWKTSAEY